jgi:hypothetical protein
MIDSSTWLIIKQNGIVLERFQFRSISSITITADSVILNMVGGYVIGFSITENERYKVSQGVFDNIVNWIKTKIDNEASTLSVPTIVHEGI